MRGPGAVPGRFVPGLSAGMSMLPQAGAG